ncbi:uncharacterized protein LOC129905719 [Episyrphus balteatus]|uniref:uncharacterized protein LOC129905719 n=1 Tax=Episyrphus balteatus TaxID=286459 RepID=UPI002486ACD9|nr:uncharacterized protein LOC129905719 [Episyrphus balteatus]
MKYINTSEDDFSCNETINDPPSDSSNNETLESITIDDDDDDANDNENEASLDANMDESARSSKQLRKACRNSGLAYVTSSGKYVPAKKVVPLTECRAKCSTRFTPEIQQAIFNEYWSLGTYEKRAEYVASMITVINKKSVRPRNFDSDREKYRTKTYSYCLEIGGKVLPTCKGCFLKTLDESEGMVKTVATKIRSGPSGRLLCNEMMRTNDSPRHGKVEIISARSTLPYFCT